MPPKRTFYRGRFAPTPTGPLHFGSLVTAVASYADALYHKGEWILRFDDIDESRKISESVDTILRTLEVFGFEWAAKPTFQTERKELYHSILSGLLQDDLAYYCGCSRKEVKDAGRRTELGIIYPGTCRNGLPSGSVGRSIRMRVNHKSTQFVDRFAGPIKQNLGKEVGDFVVGRADGYTAYQLAVVVDDSVENITHIIRGADLLTSTPRQLYLQIQLGLDVPSYGHIPLVVDSRGTKLSKSTGASAVSTDYPLNLLLAAWKFLGQSPPDRPLADVSEFWSEATNIWSAKRITTINKK
ncbi:MAG: tRNA glutamyl-Q(34) synthetase GluQRS [Acidiferrobacteraceae bacterium]|nr:tRNA glutamyl-Q(34) synthetase GluQRS [Acidiferrobacteraceae bacterium]